MSLDGVTVTQEDIENFYTACDGGYILESTIKSAFLKVGSVIIKIFVQQNNYVLIE